MGRKRLASRGDVGRRRGDEMVGPELRCWGVVFRYLDTGVCLLGLVVGEVGGEMVVSGRGGDACGMFVREMTLGGRVLLACLEGKEIVIQD